MDRKIHRASISVEVEPKENESIADTKERLFLKLIHLVDDWMVGEVIPTITYEQTRKDNYGNTSTEDSIHLN